MMEPHNKNCSSGIARTLVDRRANTEMEAFELKLYRIQNCTSFLYHRILTWYMLMEQSLSHFYSYQFPISTDSVQFCRLHREHLVIWCEEMGIRIAPPLCFVPSLFHCAVALFSCPTCCWVRLSPFSCWWHHFSLIVCNGHNIKVYFQLRIVPKILFVPFIPVGWIPFDHRMLEDAFLSVANTICFHVVRGRRHCWSRTNS